MKFLLLLHVCIFLLNTESLAADCKEKVTVYKYFEKEIPDLERNGALLKWSKVVNTIEELQPLFLGDVHMIKANVVHDTKNVASIEPKNPNDLPTLTLEDFLKAYRRGDEKRLPGLMLHLKTQEGYDSTIGVLKNLLEDLIKFPLWLHMNVAIGPGGYSHIIDPKYKVNTILDCFTTSLGLTTGLVPNAVYTDEMLKNTTSVMSKKNDYYTFRGVYLKKSWNSIHNIITKLNPILIWVEEGDLDYVDKWSLRNMLYTRRSYTFTDLPEMLRTELDGLCPKNQDMYDFFKDRVDLEQGFEKIKWHKHVKTMEELEAALAKPEYHMIKVNVVEENGEAIIVTGTLKLRQLLEKMAIKNNKGVKLHFITTQAFDVTVKNLSYLIEKLEYPIWIEANIYQGPGGSSNVVNLKYETNKEFLSCHYVALGWTTSPDDPNREYTREMIIEMRDMLNLVPDGPFIVFSMRAMYVYKALNPIDGQLHDFSRNFYFWAAEEDDTRIISKDLRDIKDFAEGYSYFDTPESMDWRLEKCPKNRDVLSYFDINDMYENLTKLEFSEFVNDDTFEEILQGDGHMIKATVSLKKIEGNDVAVVGEVLTLRKLFDNFKNPKYIKGLLLRFHTSEAFHFTIKTFYLDLRKIEKPIWLYVDIAKGQGITRDDVINTNYLLNNDAMDCCTMVYGWLTGINDMKGYTEEDAIEMESVEKGRGSTIYALRAEYTSVESLNNLKLISNIENFYIFLPNENQDVFISKDLRNILFWGRRNMYADVKEHYLLKCSINQDIHKYVGIGSYNLSHLVFTKRAIESIEEFNGYLEDDKIHMIKANVFTLANIPMVTQTLKLLEFLQLFDASDKKKGVELTFMSSEAVQDTIKLGLETLKRIQKPIWIRAHVLKGPGNLPQTLINLDYNSFNDVLDCRDVVLGWTADIHHETENVYTEQQLKLMLEYPISAKKIFYEIRGEFLGKSWELLEQFFPADLNTFKLWIPDDNDNRATIIAKEIRDIIGKYYYAFYIDISEDLIHVIMACPYNQDVYIFFYNEHLEENATVLEFSRAIKSLQELEIAMKSGKHMINVEIFEQDGEAVISVGDTELVTLGEILNAVDRNTFHVGLQLLFQTTEAFNIAMKSHYDQLRNINRPIWLNANVIKGPGGGENIVTIDYIKYNDLLDCRNMVLGWSTDSSGGVYTEQQIEDMKNIPLGNSPKIYSIRAISLLESWENLKSFKDEMFMLWAPNDDIKSLDGEKLKDIISSNEDRFFLDFSDDVRRHINGTSGKSQSVIIGFAIIFLHLIYMYTK